MRVLVAGGAGYIGSHMVHLLVSKGIGRKNILVADNLAYGHREYLPDGITFFKGDLTEPSFVSKIFSKGRIDAVIHFAGYAYVGESMESPAKYFRNNLLSGVNLLDAMQKSGCRRIIFSSSCATYGIPDKVPITEDTPARPINPYGETKLMFEQVMQWYDRLFGIRFLSLRYFNAAGADFGIGEHHEPETHLIPLAIMAALGKKGSIRIFGTDYNTPDGTCIRDYIHVTDLAEAHYLGLEYLGRNSPSGILNLGTGKGASVREIIEMVREVSGNGFRVVEDKRRPGDPAVLVASNFQAASTLGWKPSRGLRDIIKSAWEWHSSRHML